MYTTSLLEKILSEFYNLLLDWYKVRKLMVKLYHIIIKIMT